MKTCGKRFTRDQARQISRWYWQGKTDHWMAEHYRLSTNDFQQILWPEAQIGERCDQRATMPPIFGCGAKLATWPCVTCMLKARIAAIRQQNAARCNRRILAHEIEEPI